MARQVWPKCDSMSAESAGDSMRDDRIGCDRLTLARFEERGGVAREAADRSQYDVAHDAGNAEAAIAEKLVGQRLIAAQILADEAHEIVRGAGDLPAFGGLLDRLELRF